MAIYSNRQTFINQATKFLNPVKNKSSLVKKYNELTGQKQASLPRIAYKLFVEKNVNLNELIEYINDLADIQTVEKNIADNKKRKAEEKAKQKAEDDEAIKKIVSMLTAQAQAKKKARRARIKARKLENDLLRKQEEDEQKFYNQQKMARLEELKGLKKLDISPALIRKIGTPPAVKELIKDKAQRQVKKIRESQVLPGMKKYELEDNSYNGLVGTLNKISKRAQRDDEDIPIVVEVKADDGTILKSVNYTIPGDSDFTNFWEDGAHMYSFLKDTADTGAIFSNSTTTIYLASRGTGPTSKQSFRDGREVHCVLSHIRAYIDSLHDDVRGQKSINAFNKKFEKYELMFADGVPEDDLTALCDAFNIHIKVKYPLNKKTVIFGSRVKPRKVLTLTNSRLNHLDPMRDMLNLTNANRETITRDELMDIKAQLDDDKAPYMYMKDTTGGIAQIITSSEIYETNTHLKETMKIFEEINNLAHFKICDKKDPAISAFVKQGTHYNNSCLIAGRPEFKLNDEDETQHIDKRRAYATYEEHPLYEGFLGKITDMRPTDSIQAVGIYTIADLNLSKCAPKAQQLLGKMFKSGGTYPSPDLKYLESHNAKFRVVFGCWGVEPVHIKFQEEMFSKTPEGASYYALAVGKLDCHNLQTRYYMPGTEEYFLNIQNNSENAVKFFGNGELQISMEKDSNLHMGHYTAFVLSYMRLAMLDQLMEMDLSRVNMVYVDGIYYQPHEFKLLDGFVNKPSDWKKHYKGSKVNLNDRHMRDDEPIRDAYLSNNEKNFKSYFKRNYATNQEKRPHFKTELWTGAGGTGKTHKNLTDMGLIKPLYVATSHKLVSEKMAEYKIPGEVFENLINEESRCFVTGKVWKFYNVLIIDEASQIRNCDMERLLSLYPNHKIVVCGDIGYQVAPINPDENINGGDVVAQQFDNVIKLTKNFRCKCEQLATKLKFLRKAIDSRTRIHPNDLFVIKADSNTIKPSELKTLYTENDSIITGTHNAKNNLTSLVKDSVKNKYYVTKRDDKYNVGDIVICEDEPDFKGVLQHAHTIHAVQGLTIKTKLFIDTRRSVSNMDLRLIYTAMSRAQHLKNIYFIEDEDEYEGNIPLENDLPDEDLYDMFV